LIKVPISDRTVAIIGTGNIGTRLAANFAAGGQDFLLAGRDQDATRELASDLDGHAEVVSVDEAVQRADVLVLAVWFDAFKQLIAQYGEQLAGKVIVDPTNPVGPDEAGGYRKIIGKQESSGQILAGLPRAPCPRPRGRSPSVRCCSTPPTTTPRATWSPA
jgi:predicted dinucleotide-binding enzyme